MRRLLVKYSKEGFAAFLSHRETMRALEMALRRSDIPLAFSEGFNPRPRMSFSPALPLGVAAEGEYLEVAVEAEVEVAPAMESINRALPQGLRVREMQLLGTTMPRLSRWTRYGLYRVRGEGEESYVLLSLSGKGQGRLKDALEAMGTRLRGPGGGAEVTRVGLYASREEVYEDAKGTIYYYEPGKRELEKMVGD